MSFYLHLTFEFLLVYIICFIGRTPVSNICLSFNLQQSHNINTKKLTVVWMRHVESTDQGFGLSLLVLLQLSAVCRTCITPQPTNAQPQYPYLWLAGMIADARRCVHLHCTAPQTTPHHTHIPMKELLLRDFFFFTKNLQSCNYHWTFKSFIILYVNSLTQRNMLPSTW